MFAIANTVQPQEDNIHTYLHSREKFENKKIIDSHDIKDHNSSGNISEFNTISKQNTRQTPEGEDEPNSEIEQMFEFEQLCKQDQQILAFSTLEPHERHKIVCSVCKKSLGTRSALFHHMERAHGSLQYSCDYCAYSSSSRKNLQEHLQK